MTTCVYCGKDKPAADMTTEHAIPQFLGGAHAPDRYRLRNVCSRCNNVFGLYVDAAYAKSWWITNWLAMVSKRTYDSANPHAIPLACMGRAHLNPPEIASNEVCERWLGPQGEQVFWIRPEDEDLYWYAGGNPITTKKKDSRAYFCFSVRSSEDPMMTWMAFKEAFKSRSVKKVMCGHVEGADPRQIGFSDPDPLDTVRIEYFTGVGRGEIKAEGGTISLNVNFDRRFMAKLALGVGYALFGEPYLALPYCKTLQEAVWSQDDEADHEVFGTPTFGSQKDPRFESIAGTQDAVTLLITPMGEGVGINLNVGGCYSSAVLCASSEVLAWEGAGGLGYGRALVLYPSLQQGIELPLLDLVAHRSGSQVHKGLEQVEKSLRCETLPTVLMNGT